MISIRGAVIPLTTTSSKYAAGSTQMRTLLVEINGSELTAGLDRPEWTFF